MGKTTEDKWKIFCKQLVYAGAFVKNKGKESEQAFEVDKALLDHWNRTGATMLSNGVEIPLPIEHTKDPEARRGSVVGFERGEDEDGRDSIFGLIAFRDAEAEKLANSANVSVFVPPESEDGKGNTYHRPIEHVALTDYPVLPGLKKFEPIAASRIVTKPETEPEPKPEPKKMKLSALAAKLGVKIEDDADDSKIGSAIVAAFSALKKKTTPEPKPKPVPVAAGMISMAKDARELKLSRLVETGRITPAVKDKLAEIFTPKERLTLALSHTDADTSADDFDALVLALTENEPTKLAEQTSPQGALALSREDLEDETKNPLLRNAAARAEAAK